jgi:hypothetical protein
MLLLKLLLLLTTSVQAVVLAMIVQHCIRALVVNW